MPTCILSSALALGACTRESRTLDATPPQTRPVGPADPRIGDYLNNVYQVGQGGTWFSNYGCAGCHDTTAPDLRRARLPLAKTFDVIFAAIADRHGRLDYGRRVPVEQLWQLTAFVADLPAHTPDKRRRQAVDQQGEPQGNSWSGPLR